MIEATPMTVGGAGVFVAAGLTAIYGTFVPQAGVWCRNISHGPRGGNRVALTFDDGPTPDCSERVLEVLARHSVPAAFFVIGRNVAQCPELLRRMHEGGHVIGNHTYDHHHLSVFRGTGYWREQLTKTDEVVAEAIGVRPRLFRPPVGIKFVFAANAVRRMPCTMVTWSRRAMDGVDTSAERIVGRLAAKVRGGDIVTLHDGIDPHFLRKPETTVKALPELIERMRDRGLELVRLDELIGVEAYR